MAATTQPTQTHGDVTRDVLGTLSAPGKGYYYLLDATVAALAVGLGTFVVLLFDGLGHAGYTPPVMWSV